MLDEPWPKVVRGRGAMERALEAEDPVPALFDLLGDAQEVPDAELPETGVGLEWERRLASALITGADYGTRASTALTVEANGEIRLEERTRNAGGAEAARTNHAFRQMTRGPGTRRIPPPPPFRSSP